MEFTRITIQPVIIKAIEIAEELKQEGEQAGLCHILTSAIGVISFNKSYNELEAPIHNKIWNYVKELLYNKIEGLKYFYQHYPYEFRYSNQYWFDPYDFYIRINILKQILKQLQDETNININN